MQRRYLTVALLILIPTGAQAQGTVQPDSARPAPSVDFSGILFANYQYRAENAAGSANKFDVERAYLTFRAPAGERASVRITADLYQQATSGSDSYYRGWSLRAKYAYLQYDYLKGKTWRGSARLGLLQTVFVEHDESFWPRWLGNSPTERAGFFSSADAGLAHTVTLPGGFGEIYSTVTNGPGYTSREVDRFKDIATRVTIHPWSSKGPSPMRGVALTAWGYKGAIASRFVNGGAGQVGTVGDALRRDRWGVHAGSASPRLTVAAQYARRMDEGEDGLNTQASPRAVVDSVGTLLSAYASVRPLPGAGKESHPLSLLFRIDRVTTNTDTGESYDFIVGGVIWDFSSRLSMSLDYQEVTPREGRPVAATRTWFAHFVARY
ncbi:MAG: hypothetical protein ACSLFK_16720 [Gemmatimonadaceae bacterium]